MDNYHNLGEYVTTVHNPESVVEVYVDKKNQIVNELKRLNYNRYKKYKYTVSEYLGRVKGFKGVDQSLLAILNQ